jgi:hypothetical protein
VAGAAGTFEAQGVTFNYPPDWQNLTRVVAAHPPHGHPQWNAILGTGQSQVAVVAAYAGADPGKDAARAHQTELIAQDVAEQLGATFTGHVRNAGPYLLPTFAYTVIGGPQQGRSPWRVDAYVLFGPRERYVVQCQTPGPDPSRFIVGCVHILGSFRQIGTAVGAASPLEAAHQLYASAATDRTDLAHRVATEDAVRQVSGLDPSLRPPTTCFTSDGASGPLCAATNPGLFSVQFETQRIDGRWFVIRVFHCTLYGDERNCWSMGP